MWFHSFDDVVDFSMKQQTETTSELDYNVYWPRQQMHQTETTSELDYNVEESGFIHQHGDSFEQKLTNSIAKDASQLCMAELLPHIAALQYGMPGKIEAQVPLCLDFNVKTLSCTELQLVISRTDMDEGNTRPWRLTAPCEKALSNALKHSIASALAVHDSAITVNVKASLGYARYTFNRFAERPRLYMWSTALVPHVSVSVAREWLDEASTAAIAFADLCSVRKHFNKWRQLQKNLQISAMESARKIAEAEAEEAQKTLAAKICNPEKQQRSACAAVPCCAGRCKQPVRIAVAWYE